MANNTTFKAYGPRGRLQPLEEFTFEPLPLGPQDIEVKVTHCSICHSDVHILDEDWGKVKFPHAAGHEIIGHVVALGTDAKELKLGQRVGIGWQKSCCFQCKYCKKEKENLCDDKKAVAMGSNNFGGFSERVRISQYFAYPIPDTLQSEYAAPLLCAGQTVWAPIMKFGVNNTHKVGVVGIGGLGHLAIQFAAKLGAEVWAFSGTREKETEVKDFGAKGFLLLDDIKETTNSVHKKSFDFILVTAGYANQNWHNFVPLLSKDGELCFLAKPSKSDTIGNNITTPVEDLFFGYERHISGGNIGARKSMTEMLNFSAQHGVKPVIEIYPFSQINTAFSRTRDGKAKYRCVLVHEN